MRLEHQRRAVLEVALPVRFDAMPDVRTGSSRTLRQGLDPDRARGGRQVRIRRLARRHGAEPEGVRPIDAPEAVRPLEPALRVGAEREERDLAGVEDLDRDERALSARTAEQLAD